MTSLEEMVQLIKDGYKPNGQDDLAYVGLEHINQQTLNLNSVGHSSEIESNKFIFKSGDILFGKLRPYFRKVVRPKFDGVCSTDIWVIRAKDGIDQGFLFYFLANRDLISLASSGSSGTRMPRADWNHLKDTEWSIPPQPKQRAIAKILSDLDEKIELNHRMNKTLESIAQELFKKWFMDTDAQATPIPITDCVEFDPKIPVKKGAVLPYVDMKELPIEGMNVSNVISRAFAGGSRFQNGDTLLARITPCLENGKTAFVNFLQDNQPIGFGSTEFIVMRPKNGANPQFVYCLARDPEFRSFAIKSMIGSSGRQRVQRNMLETYEIPEPDRDLMGKFHETTRLIFERIGINRKEIKSLSTVRDSLLPKLMSGEIRLN